jgi:hypothetical protein
MVWHVLDKENKTGDFKNLEKQSFHTFCDLWIKLITCLYKASLLKWIFS